MSTSIEHLPAPRERRLAVRVTPDALRQIRGGSPWLYDGSITSVSHEGAPGDLAVVFADDRNFAAIGLWDPTSPIRMKVLHRGKPTQIDATFWRSVLSTAQDRRSSLAADDDTTAYRVVHGENDGLPGLVVDRYDQTLVVKLYTSAWFPHLAAVVAALVDVCAPVRIVLRLSRSVAGGETFGLSDGDTIVGDPPQGPVLFRERDLTMEADVVRGQKTGLPRPARQPGTGAQHVVGGFGARRVRQHRWLLVGGGGGWCDVGPHGRPVGAGARDGQEEPRPQPSARRGSALPGARHGR